MKCIELKTLAKQDIYIGDTVTYRVTNRLTFY